MTFLVHEKDKQLIAQTATDENRLKSYRLLERVAVVHTKPCGCAAGKTTVVLVERDRQDLHGCGSDSTVIGDPRCARGSYR